jgi:hypothetical protein
MFFRADIEMEQTLKSVPKVGEIKALELLNRFRRSLLKKVGWN